jgi:hypothetical protein
LTKDPKYRRLIVVEDSESGAVCHSLRKGVGLMWKNILRTIVCILLAIIVALAMSIEAY